MAPNCGVCLREGAPPLLPHQSQRDLLCTHTEQLQAGGGDRLESFHPGGVGAGDHVAEHEREDDGLLGKQILGFAPLVLGSIAVEFASFRNERLQLIEDSGSEICQPSRLFVQTLSPFHQEMMMPGSVPKTEGSPGARTMS